TLAVLSGTGLNEAAEFFNWYLMDKMWRRTTDKRRTYKCSVCAQISQRLEFCRPKVPVTDVPVVTSPPQPRATKLQQHVPGWTKSVEELGNSRTAETAAAKARAWAKVAEKVPLIPEASEVAPQPSARK